MVVNEQMNELEHKLESIIVSAKLLGWKIRKSVVNNKKNKFNSICYDLDNSERCIEIWLHKCNNELEDFNGQRWKKGAIFTNFEDLRNVKCEDYLKTLMKWL